MTALAFQPSASHAARYVYPRLARTDARKLIAEQREMTASDLRNAGSTCHPAAAPARALTVVPENHLLDVRDTLRGVLRDTAPSFPWPVPRERAAEFDRLLGAVLHQRLLIIPSDAAAEGVWSFLTLVLLPEVGPWRFHGRDENRLIGVPRNVLRRTWWRAHVLGSDLGGRSNGSPHLGEDELVQIFERPTLSANPLVARAIAATIHSEAPRIKGPRSEFVRDLTRRLIRLTPLIDLDGLSQQALNDLILKLAVVSRSALTG